MHLLRKAQQWTGGFRQSLLRNQGCMDDRFADHLRSGLAGRAKEA